jgi:hypothetical protein
MPIFASVASFVGPPVGTGAGGLPPAVSPMMPPSATALPQDIADRIRAQRVRKRERADDERSP